MLSTEADLLSGNPESAMRVQEAIGSRSSAIHKDYRASLRPSKVPEPRYPSLKVVVLDHHPFQKACANYLTLELTRPQGNTRAWCQMHQAPMRRCHPRVDEKGKRKKRRTGGEDKREGGDKEDEKDPGGTAALRKKLQELKNRASGAKPVDEEAPREDGAGSPEKALREH